MGTFFSMGIVRDIFFQMRLSKVKYNIFKEMRRLAKEAESKVNSEDYLSANQSIDRFNVLKTRYDSLDLMSWK